MERALILTLKKNEAFFAGTPIDEKYITWTDLRRP
jgi:hypothetical protein